MPNVWPIDYSITIDSVDISQEIVSVTFKSGICNPIGQLEIVVNPNLDFDVIPYQDVIIYIDNTKVFTGYVQTGVFSRRPYTQIMHCEDALSKVRDTWNHDMDIESHGESVEHWISYFLSLSDVSYAVASGGPAIDERLWGVTNAYQAIASLLKLVSWQLTTDADGVIHVQQNIRNAAAAIDIPRITYWERVQSDEWLRNRAVVLGRNKESSVIVDNYIEALDGEIRAAIVASPHIVWPATAYSMAWLMLNEFSTPLDTVTVECPGNPNIRVGSTVSVSDEWEDHARNGLVTSCQWRISEREGYVMTLVLDEKCPSFWLSDVEPDILYCATEGEGVWKTYNDGESWFDISGDDLNSGASAYVKDIHVIKGLSLIGTDDTVWAATLGGIYRTETGAHPWTDITADFMDNKAQSIDWWGVQVGPIDHDKIYCLGNYDSPSTTVTDDSGEVVGTIPPRWTIYMYISLDGGTTWNDYIVNSYSLSQ